MILNLAEYFTSLNGEGAHAGQLALFLRFAGCNLNCSYCDTRWACEPGVETRQVEAQDVVARVNREQIPCITITGGEPALQPELLALVETLLAETDAIVEIETNGAVDLSHLKAIEDQRLCLTIDYKLPSSGMEDSMLLANFAGLRSQDVVKFVVGSRTDAKRMVEMAGQLGLAESPAQVFASPVFGEIEPADLANFIIENNLSWVRMQVQLHKILWPGEDRGV